MVGRRMGFLSSGALPALDEGHVIAAAYLCHDVEADDAFIAAARGHEFTDVSEANVEIAAAQAQIEVNPEVNNAETVSEPVSTPTMEDQFKKS